MRVRSAPQSPDRVIAVGVHAVGIDHLSNAAHCITRQREVVNHGIVRSFAMQYTRSSSLTTATVVAVARIYSRQSAGKIEKAMRLGQHACIVIDHIRALFLNSGSGL